MGILDSVRNLRRNSADKNYSSEGYNACQIIDLPGSYRGYEGAENVTAYRVQIPYKFEREVGSHGLTMTDPMSAVFCKDNEGDINLFDLEIVRGSSNISLQTVPMSFDKDPFKDSFIDTRNGNRVSHDRVVAECEFYGQRNSQVFSAALDAVDMVKEKYGSSPNMMDTDATDSEQFGQ